MELHQVNSRVLHDEHVAPDAVDGHDIVPDGVPVNQDVPEPAPGADLEKKPTAISSVSYEETYPEGGLKAWLVVLGAWFAMMSAMGLMNSLAVFQAYTLSHQLKGYSEGTVGWVFSVYTFLAFFCGIYIGPVFDKYGPRWLVIAGVCCTVVGVICMSFSQGEFASSSHGM